MFLLLQNGVNPISGSDANGANLPALTPQQQNGSSNLPAAPTGAGGSGPGKVPVQFVVPEYLTHWGQVLKVVGSLEELGSWRVEKVRYKVLGKGGGGKVYQEKGASSRSCA